MPLTIYLDAQPAGSSSAEQPVSGKSICRKKQPVSGNSICRKTLVKEHMQSKTAMFFLCISGTQDDTGKLSFRSTKHTLSPREKAPKPKG